MSAYGISGRVSPGFQGPMMVAHRPAAVLPQTGTASPMFKVAGGPIRIHQWLTKLTIASNATANNLTPVADPTSGLADVNLATATSVASLGVGTLINPSGAGIGVALQKAGATSGMNQPIVVDIGNLAFTTSGNNPGAGEQFLLYQPLVQGAYVTPVLPSTVRGQAAAKVGDMRWVRRQGGAIPASGVQSAILRVTGGPILLWALVGKVTLAASATAVNLSVIANPTSGLTDVVLATATAIANTALSNLLSLQVAGIGSAIAIGGAAMTLLTPIIVDTGTIDLLSSAATNPMQVAWNALWQPLHPGGRLIIA